ncbi:DUF3087 family protein [Halopseudomonas phragmitis]|uniref:DUF3087 domain-containing protein n=1 Tax=Halopseudomonas phragmitis TaxID=1931241 RepID=A0A1V0B3Q1_9GAMM|nr:DUF3087 family protein [Halopseudomonas phragmitis]AQZ94558.1 hypothetical protein BVH74_07225 [Halopseudomonas phragmitis]
MFEIQRLDPENYRQQTRRSSLILIVIFATLAMLLASLSVQLFGEPGGNNFRWNLAGILAGLALTVLLVRGYLYRQPWMAAALYGWRLKRNLMRITNVMHLLKAGVERDNPQAMKLLRFYHLGLEEMHRLEGNAEGLSQMVREMDQHRERMEKQGLEVDLCRLDEAWMDAVKNDVRE